MVDTWREDPPNPNSFSASEGELYRRRFHIRNVLDRCRDIDPDRRDEILRDIQSTGIDILPDLRTFASSPHPEVATLASRGLALLIPEEIGTDLAAGLQRDEEHYPLELGAALMSRLGHPDIEVQRVVGDVEELTRKAEAKIQDQLQDESNVGPLEVLFQLGEFWREEGFQGNTDDYYDVRNSWLPDILERRQGMPIALSVLYVALCRGLGLSADGVGMPFHFIVRVQVSTEGSQGFIFIDPFHGARPLDLSDCRKLVESSGQKFDPAKHLKSATAREIFIRMCNNLLAIHDHGNQLLEAERVATVLLHLNPEDPVPYLIRAERRMRRGEHRLAREDIYGALCMEPDERVAEAAQQLLRKIEFGQSF